MKKPTISAGAGALVLASAVAVSSPAQAASCSSITAEVPYGTSGQVTAHSWLSCNGSMSGWVKSSLIRVRSNLPEWKIATTTSGTQNSSYNFHAYARGCDAGAYGYKTVADSSLGYTATSATKTVSCG